MKIWVEDNITSTTGKKFSIVEVIEILDIGCKVKYVDGTFDVKSIGFLNKGFVKDTDHNRNLMYLIGTYQNVISSALDHIKVYENKLERMNLEEIENDPNF